MTAELGDPIRYACVASFGEILVGITSDVGLDDDDEDRRGEDLEAVAAQCVADTPSHHRHYHRTSRGRSHGFLIEGSYAYFAVYAESLGWEAALRFLRRVRTAFLKSDGGADFGPVLRYLMQMPPSRSLTNGEEQQHLSHRKEGKTAAVVNVACGEFGRPVKYEKISRELSMEDTKAVRSCADFPDRGSYGSFSDKSSGGGISNGRELARKVWRRHVKVVLMIDLLICLVLFCVWLSICKGFQCING